MKYRGLLLPMILAAMCGDDAFMLNINIECFRITAVCDIICSRLHLWGVIRWSVSLISTLIVPIAYTTCGGGVISIT